MECLLRSNNEPLQGCKMMNIFSTVTIAGFQFPGLLEVKIIPVTKSYNLAHHFVYAHSKPIWL